MCYDVISFDLIRACLAIPVGSGLYSASFGRFTEPRKRVSAHAETIPIAQHHCPLRVGSGRSLKPSEQRRAEAVICNISRFTALDPLT